MPYLIIFIIGLIIIIFMARKNLHKNGSGQDFEQRNHGTLRLYQSQISELSSKMNDSKTDIRIKLECAQKAVDCYSRLQSFCSQSHSGDEWFCHTCSFPVSQAKEAIADYTKLLSELQVFHTDFFPIVSPDEEIQSDWTILPCDHDSYEQLIRQKRSIKTAPVYVDHRMRQAFFLSGDMNAIYSVSLFSCTCPDYEKRGLPCKHMYRLFYELTVGTDCTLGIDVTNLEETIGFLKLSDQDKVSHIKTVRSLHNSGNRPLTTYKSSYIKKALKMGLLSQSDSVDYTFLLNSRTKDEIIISLRNSGITDCYPSWTKVRVIDYTVEHHKQYLKKEYKDFVAVVIPAVLESWCSGLASVVNSRFSDDTESLQEWNHRFEEFL